MTDLPEVSMVHKAVEYIKTLQMTILKNYFAFGETLHALGIGSKKGKKLYRLYASHITTEKDFAKELGYSVSQLHNIVGTWQQFSQHALDEDGKFLSVHPTRLVKLLPLNLKEEDKAEWCKKAATLNAEAFENEIRNYKGLIGTDQCEHEDCETIAKCKACGKIMKVI